MPTKIKPNAMRKSDAADFCGISVSQFGKMIKLGTMPNARNAGGAKIWLRTELEDALTALAPDGERDEACDTNKVFGIAT